MEKTLPMPYFLNETADEIHKRMLEKSPSGICTVEGDFFWDMTRPASEEIAIAKNMQLQNVIRLAFEQTCYEEFLDLKGDEHSLVRKLATRSIGNIKFTGNPGTVIEKGKIVCTQSVDLNQCIEFEILETKKIDNTGTVVAKAECKETGTIGNVRKDAITILSKPINGIKEVINEEDFKGGTDIEDDDSFRERIFEKIRTPATSGNKYDYVNWAKEVNGVGDAKPFPLWNGPGTIKVVIVDSNKHAATPELINEVFNHIEENRPIGPTVLVVSAKEKNIDVKSKLVLANSYSIGQVQKDFAKDFQVFLKETAFKLSYVSIAKIGNILLNTPGVLDYTDLKINNSTFNLGLDDEEIPILGTIELGV